jgi:hypothetical protein
MRPPSGDARQGGERRSDLLTRSMDAYTGAPKTWEFFGAT